MLSIFLAAFLGAAYGATKLYDYSKKNSMRSNASSYVKSEYNRMDSFIDKVTNRSLENEFLIRLREANNMQDLDYDIKVELEKTWSKYYQSFFSFARPKNEVVDNALRALMANRGYLTLKDATGGIFICYANYKTVKELVDKLNNALLSRGISEDVFVVSSDPNILPVKLKDYHGQIGGYVNWKPYIKSSRFRRPPPL